MDLSLLVSVLCFLWQIILGGAGEVGLRRLDCEDCSASSEIELPKSNERKETKKKPDWVYEAEKKAGDTADLFGSNPHHSYSTLFNDLGRRFVPVYPYKEIKKNDNEDQELVPIKASPAKVLDVAIKSAMEQASAPVNNAEADKKEKEILRTGDYWNAVWVEEVDPKSVLRSYNKRQQKKRKVNRSSVPDLGTVRAKIMPGSKLYQLVSALQPYSSRLLYVINSQ